MDKYELLKKLSAKVNKEQLEEIIRRNLSVEELNNLLKFWE